MQSLFTFLAMTFAISNIVIALLASPKKLFKAIDSVPGPVGWKEKRIRHLKFVSLVSAPVAAMSFYKVVQDYTTPSNLVTSTALRFQSVTPTARLAVYLAVVAVGMFALGYWVYREVFVTKQGQLLAVANLLLGLLFLATVAVYGPKLTKTRCQQVSGFTTTCIDNSRLHR